MANFVLKKKGFFVVGVAVFLGFVFFVSACVRQDVTFGVSNQRVVAKAVEVQDVFLSSGLPVTFVDGGLQQCVGRDGGVVDGGYSRTVFVEVSPRDSKEFLGLTDLVADVFPNLFIVNRTMFGEDEYGTYEFGYADSLSNTAVFSATTVCETDVIAMDFSSG